MNEREYDRIHNEGGEGYNPIHEARIRKEMEIEAARPKTISEQIDSIRHKISVRDCSIARECGTFDQAEIDALREEIKTLEDREEAEFLANWSLDTTKERREEWNTMIKGFGSGKMSQANIQKMYAVQGKQGWMLADLKRAVKIHNL